MGLFTFCGKINKLATTQLFSPLGEGKMGLFTFFGKIIKLNWQPPNFYHIAVKSKIPRSILSFEVVMKPVSMASRLLILPEFKVPLCNVLNI